MMAICSTGASSLAVNLSSNTLPASLPLLSNVSSVAVSVAFKRTPLGQEVQASHHSNAKLVAAATANLGSLRGRTGLLERPTFGQSQFDTPPEAQEGGDIGRLSNRKGLRSGDSYRVLLVDDVRHTEKLVESALPQVVPSITVEETRKLFHESRGMGVAIVIIAVKEHAEFYAQMMIRRGLRSTIEPDSNWGI